MKMKQKLLLTFKEAIRSVKPELLIYKNVQFENPDRVRICDKHFTSRTYHIIGFGKAVLSMAQALCDILKNRIKSGILIVPENARGINLPNIEIFTGAENNLPDSKAVSATDAVLSMARNIPHPDIVIVLISGGGSSLLCKPVEGLTLESKLQTIKLLVAAGANIKELNVVRKRLSAVKGGGLGEILQKNPTISLILSDIIGNPVELIASGPTVPNNDPPNAAMEIARKYKLEMKIPKHVMDIIKNEFRPRKWDACAASHYIIGNNEIALKAAFESESLTNCQKFILSNRVEGDVQHVAQSYHELALATVDFLCTGNRVIFSRRIRQNQLIAPEACEMVDKIQAKDEAVLFILGGETTVKLGGGGKGGRNQELCLHFSKMCYETCEQFGSWNVLLLCGGTDGIDGPTDAAGAFGCAEAIAEGHKLGLQVNDYLYKNDSYHYFMKVANGEYLIKTGHTDTNVMDIHLLLISKFL